MLDIFLVLLLLCIAGGIVYYLYREKKHGATCIGCPYARQCAKSYKVGRSKKKAAVCSCDHTKEIK